MVRKQAVFVACSIVGAATGVWWFHVSKCHRKTTRIVGRSHYIEVMKELAIKAFGVLFEFAQMRARVDAVTVGRSTSQSLRTIIQNDSNVRNALLNTQESILSAHKITIGDMMEAQKSFDSKIDAEISELVACIPKMFEQYVSGDFPTLPASISEPLVETDSELISQCTRSFARHATNDSQTAYFEDTIAFRNTLAHRLNACSEFRKSVFLAVLVAQQNLRNTL